MNENEAEGFVLSQKILVRAVSHTSTSDDGLKPQQQFMVEALGNLSLQTCRTKHTAGPGFHLIMYRRTYLRHPP
jgi:hypothetical protein